MTVLKASLSLLLVLILLASANGQSEAYYEQADVTYYMAVGNMGSENLSTSPDYAGTERISFVGCAVVKLRPDMSLGRVRLVGDLGSAPMNLEWGEFTSPMEDISGISTDVPVDGSRYYGEIQHPRVDATVAAWGTSYMTIWGQPFSDPATGYESFETSMFITKDGMRNETGAIAAPDGSVYQPGGLADLENDWEMHLRVKSRGGFSPSAERNTFEDPASPALGAPNYFTPNEAYANSYAFNNNYFGGTASLSFNAEELGTGDNRLNFTIRDPDGLIMDQFELLNPTSSYQFEFDLDKFGVYGVDVEGEVSMSRYEMTLTQYPPTDFDLNFWWEELSFGSYAPAERQKCEEKLDSESFVVSPIVGRLPPNPYEYLAMTVTIIGVLAAFLTIVTLTILTYGIAKHHRMASK